MWKKGRGKLGIFAPLFGTWHAQAGSALGHTTCERKIRQTLGNRYVELRANWRVGETNYEERAYFGFDADGGLRFWSFTSDGKQSSGKQVSAPELHPQALVFEAEMPAGLARMAYWPLDDGGIQFVVESRTKKGWRRFISHHYRRVQAPRAAAPE